VIYGIGTDIVAVARMRRGLERYGEKFARRILSDSEMQEFAQSGKPDSFLAKRFAAKEAAVKALGTGFVHGISLRHVYVEHDELGKPILAVCGRAAELWQERGVGEGQISLSDERDYAVAFVVLMRKI